ncbi:MAG TPA: YHS domain-containing protein [Gammaproteobacteria bacterium]|nr:YHS domain-containing protein [Gammaproteobacteria bacterium]
MLKDPVCNRELDPQDAHAVSIKGGRAFYFCSPDCRVRFEKNPGRYAAPQYGVRISVGVMGSASGELTQVQKESAYALGQETARRGFILVTGACPGLPYESARGHWDSNGLSIGISPALSLREHLQKYDSPIDVFDMLVYTGSGLMGREVTNIHSSDMVVIVGGQSGTLGEFAIAFDEGKLIGVLSSTGGITGLIPDLVQHMTKPTGAHVLFDDDADNLVDRMVQAYEGSHFRRPTDLYG